MELSYQAIKTSKQAREADEMRTEARRRSLLVLMFNYLMDEGYVDTACSLEQETNLGLRKFEVCDNVDLDTIIMEYESYYFIKFQKYPKLTKRLPETGDRRSARICGRKRAPCTVTQTLPRINSIQRPTSKGGLKKTDSKLAIRDIDKDSGENGLSGAHEPAEFGLNVSPIMRNGGAEEAPVKRGHLIDYRGLIQDAIKGAACSTTNGTACNTEPSERLLKPLSAFSGMNSEMRELAAVISRHEAVILHDCSMETVLDIYLHNPNVRWDDIIGLEDAKRLVKEAVVYPIKYPQLFTGILSPWKGLLLYGPPGTGKTLLAKAVATECQTTFFNISTSTIVSKWRGDSEKLVRVLFELARYHAPSTIFLDELESVMSQRGAGQGGEHEGSRRMKTELLVQMDGLAHSDDLVFVLAASNLPWELDHGMLRRLDKRILVGLPCEAARQAMIAHWLPPLSTSGGVDLRTQLDYSVLGQEMEGYSGSDVKLACKEAAMRPVRKIFDALENHQAGNSNMPVLQLDTVTTADFMEVLAHTKPSVRNLTEKYMAWEKEYQSV